MPELGLDKLNLKWLEERTILLAPTGSHAYGTATETSDHDYKGVCIPPVDYYLGLEAFNEYNNTGGKNFKNTKDDVDVNIIHINKFVKDAMLGVPNNIEILFVEPEQFIKLTGLGEILLDNRKLFLSKQIKNKFGGYAYSQMQKMKARQDLVDKFGYDTKFFMHSIRLLTSAIDILLDADFSTLRPNRAMLLDCRNGAYTFEEALELVDYYDKLLQISFEKSKLPAHPDYKAINKMLIEINKLALELWGEL